MRSIDSGLRSFDGVPCSCEIILVATLLGDLELLPGGLELLERLLCGLELLLCGLELLLGGYCDFDIPSTTKPSPQHKTGVGASCFGHYLCCKKTQP